MRVGTLVVVVWLALGGLVTGWARPARVATPDSACLVSNDTHSSLAARNLQRATLGYAALQRAFYLSEDSLYREQFPDESGAYAYLWPYSRAFGATLALAGASATLGRYDLDLQARLTGLDAYWNADAEPAAYDSAVRWPYGAGGDRFYDDNVWIGLQLVEVYQLTGDAAALAGARRVFAFMVAGWDADPTHPAPGGVFWVAADWNRERGAVSTATGALLGLQLYDLTHEPWQLTWAQRMYLWNNQALLQPNGLYADHIDLDGTLDADPTSYNQGAMLAASVLLYRVTGELGYLNWAQRIADAALARFGPVVAVGGGQVAYNAIFFNDLLLLEQATGEPRYRAAMQTYADRLWRLTLTDPDHLLRAYPDAPAYLIDQATLVELYANLAQSPASCGAVRFAPVTIRTNRRV